MSDMSFKLIESKSNNPWYNLALEEYLLSHNKQNEVILYLWQNNHTVVIGANQNPWKECNIELLEKDGGKLARRLSGGGAVYHDLGNLNFTFIMNKKDYDFEKQISVIIDAVKKFGIKAEFTGRNDIVVNSKKISGNAFYFSGDKAYHHGTLLVDSDFNKLVEYLNVSKEKIKSKGIDSVRSRVTNLTECDSNINVEKIKEELKAAFVRIYGEYDEVFVSDIIGEDFEEIEKKYSSWDFRFGDTPKFDVVLNNRFPWGEVNINLKLLKGKISEVKIYTDAMDVNFVNSVEKLMIDLPLEAAIIKDIFKRNQIVSDYQDFIEWLTKEIQKL